MITLLAASAFAAPVVTVFQDGSPPLDHAAIAKVLDKQGISKPRFFPLADLYSTVDAANRGAIQSALSETESMSHDAMAEEEWAQKALALRDLIEKLVPGEGDADRNLLFRTYVELGRMAENTNNPTPPFYLKIGGEVCNAYWYQAGAMAHNDPSLLRSVGPEDAKTTNYKKQIDSGKSPKLKVSFQGPAQFDKKAFALKYRLFLDGLEALIEDQAGTYEVPLGTRFVRIIDKEGPVLLKRIDARDAGEVGLYDARPAYSALVGVLDGVKKCDALSLDSEVDTKLGEWASRHGVDSVNLLFVDPAKQSKSTVVVWKKGSLTKKDCLE